MVGRATRTRLLRAALGAAALAGGCASVRVVQKVADAPTYASVYVIVYESPVSPSEGRELSGAMMQALGAHTGARWTRVLTGLEFDTSFLERDIDRVGAQAVLTLKPIGAHSGRYGEIVALSYAASLEDRASNRPLWVAKVDFSVLAVQDVADMLVERLVKDHLIGPVVASN